MRKCSSSPPHMILYTSLMAPFAHLKGSPKLFRVASSGRCSSQSIILVALGGSFPKSLTRFLRRRNQKLCNEKPKLNSNASITYAPTALLSKFHPYLPLPLSSSRKLFILPLLAQIQALKISNSFNALQSNLGLRQLLTETSWHHS